MTASTITITITMTRTTTTVTMTRTTITMTTIIMTMATTTATKMSCSTTYHSNQHLRTVGTVASSYTLRTQTTTVGATLQQTTISVAECQTSPKSRNHWYNLLSTSLPTTNGPMQTSGDRSKKLRHATKNCELRVRLPRLPPSKLSNSAKSRKKCSVGARSSSRQRCVAKSSYYNNKNNNNNSSSSSSSSNSSRLI